MKRKNIKGFCIGKKKINLNGQNIKISVYTDFEGSFSFVKGKRINLKSRGKEYFVDEV